ncbi:fas apoptotic inhibitory molecule 1 isoform X1 [Hippoglossus stenolepis]|uniref:fas apoptotic inhibitory molecule 1 isoform X1 n=1 Tax=Hippoglossus stenolepis TaxID=195615 RepID=UPI00159C4715|nr:fas apoptotic inhibitory molecule 1 isoform X1 [Hippoglossus stenolepis]
MKTLGLTHRGDAERGPGGRVGGGAERRRLQDRVRSRHHHRETCCLRQRAVIRRDWMFKLVGKETFTVGGANTKATISMEAVSGFAYEYTLEVEGKSLQKFMDNRTKTTETWLLRVDGEERRVVLEKDTMDVWCNGQKMETTGEFVDDGTETRFLLGEHECCIKATGSRKKSGIVHHFLLDGEKISAPAQ